MIDDRIYSQIERLVRCPVDWPNVTGIATHPHGWLLWDWYSCLLETAVSVDETAAIHDVAAHGRILFGKYDKHTVANINLRLEESKSLFSRRSQRLSQLNFLSASHGGKHFRAKLPQDKILIRSKNAPSLFFSDHPADEIKKAFWTWFLSFFDTPAELNNWQAGEAEHVKEHLDRSVIWNKFIQDAHVRTAAKCMKEIGAVDGWPSCYLCFDIGLAASVIHAYPISGQEAISIMTPSYVAGVELLE